MNVVLGSRVKDKITGFTGIATGRATYLHASASVQVTPEESRDGKPLDPVWLDEQRIELAQNQERT